MDGDGSLYGLAALGTSLCALPSQVLATMWGDMPLLLFAASRPVIALTFATALALLAHLLVKPLLARLPPRLHRLLRHRLTVESSLACAHMATFTTHPAVGLLVATLACSAGGRIGRGAGRLSVCALAALAPGAAAWARHLSTSSQLASAASLLRAARAGGLSSTSWRAQLEAAGGWLRLGGAASALGYSSDAQWSAVHVTVLVLARQLGGGADGRGRTYSVVRASAAAAAVLCVLATAGRDSAPLALEDGAALHGAGGAALPVASLGTVASDDALRMATVGVIITELL